MVTFYFTWSETPGLRIAYELHGKQKIRKTTKIKMRVSISIQLNNSIDVDGASLTHLCSRWFKIENIFILNKLLIQFDNKNRL